MISERPYICLSRLFYSFNWRIISFFKKIHFTLLGVDIGSGVTIRRGVIIKLNKKVKRGFIKIGNNTAIANNTILKASGGTLEIGNNSLICRDGYISFSKSMKIGNDVTIAQKVCIIDANHNFGRTDLPIKYQGTTGEAITIGDNVWIGHRVTILKGVIIGDGCVIGAGAVVTKDILPNSVAVGVPARVIKKRT